MYHIEAMYRVCKYRPFLVRYHAGMEVIYLYKELHSGDPSSVNASVRPFIGCCQRCLAEAGLWV